MSVGKIILEQLGGRAFVLMTGAKNFQADDSALCFHLPGGGGFCKNGINRVTVRLMLDDTYTVFFEKVRKGVVKEIARHENVYCEELAEVFRRETGLETRMPNFVRS